MHVLGSFYANSDLATLDVDHLDGDVVADVEGCAYFSGEDEQVILLPVFSECP